MKSTLHLTAGPHLESTYSIVLVALGLEAEELFFFLPIVEGAD
jgi:hypothetical protein